MHLTPHHPILVPIQTFLIGTLAYSFLLEWPSSSSIVSFITSALTFSCPPLDATEVALFNLMGVQPAIMALLVLPSDRPSRRLALPFILASIVGGMFVLCPYLLLLAPPDSPLHTRTKPRSKPLLAFLLASSFFLVAYALAHGSLSAFAHSIRTKPLILVMLCDFAAFSLAALAYVPAPFALVPVFGPLLYLLRRPLASLSPFLPDAHAIAGSVPQTAPWTYIVGTHPGDWQSAMATKHGAVGLHPWFMESHEQALALLESTMARQPPNLGVGEIGLDKTRKDFNDQIAVFKAQLALAVASRRRISVHCVRAHGLVFELLAQLCTTRLTVYLHAYSGSPDMTRQVLTLPHDVYFGLCARHSCLDSFSLIPASKILIESDLPVDDARREAYLEAAAALVHPRISLMQLRLNFLNFVQS